MYYIYIRTPLRDYIHFTLMDSQVKFRSKANARAYLYTLGFSRSEQGRFVILHFRNPPEWVKLPLNFVGEL